MLASDNSIQVVTERSSIPARGPANPYSIYTFTSWEGEFSAGRQDKKSIASKDCSARQVVLATNEALNAGRKGEPGGISSSALAHHRQQVIFVDGNAGRTRGSDKSKIPASFRDGDMAEHHFALPAERRDHRD